MRLLLKNRILDVTEEIKKDLPLLNHPQEQINLTRTPEECPFLAKKNEKGYSGEELIKIFRKTNVPIRKTFDEGDIFNVLIQKNFLLFALSVWAFLTLFSNIFIE
jgi:hypothetical protein